MKMRCLGILRFFARVILGALFLKAAYESIEKLKKKPVASAISFRNGDDNHGNIRHPIVTFCHGPGYHYFVGSKLLDNHCNCISGLFGVPVCAQKLLDGSGDWNWGEWNRIFVFCFKKAGDKSFKSINESTLALSRSIHEVLGKMSYGSVFNEPSIDLTDLLFGKEPEFEKYLDAFFHDKYGICWSIDFQKFGHDLVQPADLFLEFKHSIPNPGKYVDANGRKITYVLALHEKPADRYTALKQRGILLNNGTITSVEYKKTLIESISTDSIPCTMDPEYNYNHCVLQMQEAEFIGQFNCRLPFMNQLLVNKTELCQDVSKVDEMYNYWGNILQEANASRECPLVKRCHSALLEINDRVHIERIDQDISRVHIKITDSIIQQITDNYSYDIQSFIGDIGGTLGLLLGYSFMSSIDLLEYAVSRCRKWLLERFWT